MERVPQDFAGTCKAKATFGLEAMTWLNIMLFVHFFYEYQSAD
jgi:hypothetical protein